MKRILSNLSYSFAANLVTMLVSVLIVLLIPKFWGDEPYGYFQLYLFYISYVGFFHLGWVDGIYLRIGGKSYTSLDGPLYAAQFFLLAVLSAAAAAAIVLVSPFFVQDPNQLFVVRMFCVCIAVYLPVTYINYILQATNCIKEYARILLSEKLVFIVLLILLLIGGETGFRSLIYADLAGKLVALVLAVVYARTFLFSGLCSLERTVREMFVNISVGCKLMVANVASMLIIGIVRFAIQSNWGVTVFGKVSLALSVSNLFIVFVTAVSVVLFPVLKQVNGSRQVEIYDFIRHLLMPALFLMLLFYCPVQFVLGNYLPGYRESLRYLAIMLPVCVFECKMSLLVNTYLKVLRKEWQILYVNLAVVAMSFLMTLLTVYMWHSLNAAVAGIVVLIAARVYIAEVYLARTLGFSIRKELLLELVLTVVFILSSWFLGGWKSMLIYAAAYLAYLAWMWKDFRKSLAFIRNGGI